MRTCRYQFILTEVYFSEYSVRGRNISTVNRRLNRLDVCARFSCDVLALFIISFDLP